MNLICDIPHLQLLAPETAPSWLSVVIEGMRVHATPGVTRPPVRVKPVNLDGHKAYMLKNAGNRVRVLMISRGHGVHTFASMPNRVIEGSPYIPQYPNENDPVVEKSTWTINEKGLVELSRYCTEKMEQRTEWSDADQYPRIPLSPTGVGGFIYGQILPYVKPLVIDNEPCWKVRFQVDEKVHERIVKQSAIRYPDIHPGYILIWKSEDEADVANEGEILAFTRLVD